MILNENRNHNGSMITDPEMVMVNCELWIGVLIFFCVNHLLLLPVTVGFTSVEYAVSVSTEYILHIFNIDDIHINTVSVANLQILNCLIYKQTDGAKKTTILSRFSLTGIEWRATTNETMQFIYCLIPTNGFFMFQIICCLLTCIRRWGIEFVCRWNSLSFADQM